MKHSDYLILLANVYAAPHCGLTISAIASIIFLVLSAHASHTERRASES